MTDLELSGWRKKQKMTPWRKIQASRIKLPPLTERILSTNLRLLFFALPTEIQVQIVSLVTYVDLLSLRQTSHSFHHLIHTHETTIVRNIFSYPSLRPRHSELLLQLYPPPTRAADMKLSYLFSLSNRYRACFHLASALSVNVSESVFGASHGPKYWKSLRPKCANMIPKMIPGLCTLFHFFETYRSKLLGRLDDPLSRPLLRSNAIEESIISTYSGDTLLEAHQIYQILHASLSRALRPPSYAGTVERSLRGWRRAPASNDDIVKLLIFGNLPAVWRVMTKSTYNTRVEALDTAMHDLTLPSPPTSPGTSNRSVLKTARPSLVPMPSRSLLPTIGFIDTDSIIKPLEPSVFIAASSTLPPIHDLWQRTAQRLLLSKEVVTGLNEITDTYEFMGELMESDDEREDLRKGSVGASGDADEENGDEESVSRRQPLVSSRFGNYEYFG
jgi:hypothetical protein